MPKQERYAIKQTLGSAMNELTKAQEKIVVTAQPFQGVHDEYYEAFASIVAGIEQLKEMLQKVSDAI